MKNLFTGRLSILLVFAIFTIAPLISESLLGNTLVTMETFKKCLGTISSKTSTISLTLFFWEFAFSFNVRCVSRKFATCLHLSQKMIADAVYLFSRCYVRRI